MDFRQLTRFILVDEADNFMSQNFPALKRIMKEGREFGVGTILSTQFLRHFGSGDDDYSSYILTWVVHNVSDLKRSDIDFVFKSSADPEVSEQLYQGIKAIGKHQSIAQFAEIKDRVVIVNGVSKAYAMTGWRIGFIAGPEWIVKASNKLQGQYTSGPCSVSQKAAEAAYTGTQAPVEEMRKAFERRRDLIVKLAKEVPGFEVNVPEGAFYLFPKCSSFFGKSAGDRKIENSDDLAMYLLEVAHVACVGGTSFGAPECIRMSYATSDENIVEAISRIKEALSKLV